MSKPALGRGLGSLLSSRTTPTTATGAPDVSPGVAALINGTQSSQGTDVPPMCAAFPQRIESAAQRTVFRGMLVAADLLLCLLALLFVQRQPSLQFHELLLCVVAVVMGAVLSCAAVVGESSRAVRLVGTE